MITTAELHSVAEEEGLRFDQTEKDYVIPQADRETQMIIALKRQI